VYRYFGYYQDSSARLAGTQPTSQRPLDHSLQPLDNPSNQNNPIWAS